MNIVFALGHPAHYHLFKNASKELIRNGHRTYFVITPKDILEKLLIADNVDYSVLAPREKRNNLFGKLFKIFSSTKQLVSVAKQCKADILVGCLSQIAYAGLIIKKPSIFVGEDDFSYTWLQGLITYPFVTKILAPNVTNVSIFSYKKTPYQGYQKLSYLHPNYFVVKREQKDESRKQILIRLVNLSAYHDLSAKGLNNKLLSDFIAKYSVFADIHISAERELPKSFEGYRVKVDVNKIHEFLLNSDLFIGDSQSMAVEAALLGVPNIRVNNFAGKINVLNELEFKYGLTNSLSSENAFKLLDLANELLSGETIPNMKKKRQKMLSDKIDVTAFLVWFIENYPQSAKIMKENPNYQYNFK